MNIFLVIVSVILVVMAAGILTCLSDIEKKLEKNLMRLSINRGPSIALLAEGTGTNECKVYGH
jgi:hypothetical protein